MANLTPKSEGITGTNCTGTDGTTGRTYTLTNLNYYSVINFIKQGVDLHEGDDFTISGGIVTFNILVWDTDLISLRYFVTDTSAIVVAGYSYTSTANVYMTAGISTSVVASADVTNHILRAETEICRLTKNIYWNIVLDAQCASSGGNNTISKTGSAWATNDFVGLYVWVYSGTGSVQLRKIISNTSDTITTDRNWTTTNPDNTSKFKVFYVPADFTPYISDLYDGNNLNYFYIPYYPVKKVEALSIGYTTLVSVTPSNLYLWEKTGKIAFKTTAEAQLFDATYPMEINLSYWYGVDNLPYDIKRLVELRCALQVLAQQMGGTYNQPSSVTLPEATIAIGQASVNIKNTMEVLQAEYDSLLKQVKIWPQFG
jgi:hypothetical protein